MKFRDLTPEQIQAVCNGCGGKGSIIDPPEFLFTASCDHHDFNYWLGGSEEDRKRADQQFYQAMLVDAFQAAWPKCWWYALVAFVYYICVRLFGKKFFYYAPHQRTKADLDGYVANAEGEDR